MRSLKFVSAFGFAASVAAFAFQTSGLQATQVHDRTIEMAALQKLQEKISPELRGTISMEDEATVVFVDPKKDQKLDLGFPSGTSVGGILTGPKLKPIVGIELNDFIDEDGLFLDRTMTGSISKSDKSQPSAQRKMNDFIDEEGLFVDQTITGSVSKTAAPKEKVGPTIWERFDSSGRLISNESR